jgi:hypothetical protein
VSNGNTEKMLFIPFSYSTDFFTRRPTGVDVHTKENADTNGFLYTNADNAHMSTITLQIGDSVDINVNSPSGVFANTFQSGWGGFSYNESALIGSLVTTCTVTTSNFNVITTPTGSTNTIFNDLASAIGYKMQNQNPTFQRIVLREFQINLSNTTTGSGFATDPTGTNPRTLSFQLTIMFNTVREYFADIVVRFTANIAYFTIPFNMPCPGDVAAGDWGYAITKMNIIPTGKTSQSTNLFTQGGFTNETSISSFSFPIVLLKTFTMVGGNFTEVSPRITLNVLNMPAPNDVSFASVFINTSVAP